MNHDIIIMPFELRLVSLRNEAERGALAGASHLLQHLCIQNRMNKTFKSINEITKLILMLKIVALYRKGMSVKVRTC